MGEQPALDQPGCSTASLQRPDTLHIDLPHVDPEDLCFTINKCLVQISPQHWELMTDGLVSCEMMTVLANCCMDVIQTLSEAILDVVMPLVYRYMRTYGSFSPAVLDLTEDRINTHLGDTIGQALANSLKFNVQDFVATNVLSQLLLRHISKTINSVLALSTQTPVPESRLPVFFVSGCVTSIRDLYNMVCQLATILLGALGDQGQLSQTTLFDFSGESEFPICCLDSSRELKKLVRTYIIRMVNVLKSGPRMPHCEMSSCNDSAVCIRVGTNLHILTMEDQESQGQQSATASCSGVDAIPGAVPDRDDAESHSESCLHGSVTVIGATENHSRCLGPNESIGNIADEMVLAFSEGELQGAAETYSCETADHNGQELVDNVKIRELTDRIFNLVMSGQDYQLPLVPAGSRTCNTTIYEKLKRGDFINPSIVAHALYMRTEEVVTRCAMQVLVWSGLHAEDSDCPSSLSADELSDEPDFVLVPGPEAGDRLQFMFVTPPPSARSSSVLSQRSDATYDVTPEPLEPTRSQLLVGIVHTSLLTLLTGEMLTAIGIRNRDIILEVVKKAVMQLHDVDPMVYNYFRASLMGQSYKDICQTVISDLLLEFGSLEVVQEAVISGDSSFEEAILRALRKQLTIPTSPVPHGNAAKKTTSGFVKKFKRLCCKRNLKKAGKTTPVISLTSDPDDNELQDYLSKEEPLREQTDQRQCPRMSRIARNVCSSSKKMFSTIARALGRPFVACFSPKGQ